MKTLDEMIEELENMRRNEIEAIKYWETKVEDSIYNPEIQEVPYYYRESLELHENMQENYMQIITWLRELKQIKKGD